jgi:hypothetical protein
MVVGLPKVFPPKGVYKGCVLGNHHQEPFDSGKVWREQNLLNFIHSDVSCINIPSLEVERYILTFIDDLSHFTWVYFLNNKNLVCENFKEFQSFSENKCGSPIKCLRSHNGGEYVKCPFE